MNRKVKYATKKDTNGERMAVPVRYLKAIGFGIAAYGLLVLADPTQYAKWLSNGFAPIVGFILLFAGIILMLK